jgi:hypothetical protein
MATSGKRPGSDGEEKFPSKKLKKQEDDQEKEVEQEHEEDVEVASILDNRRDKIYSSVHTTRTSWGKTTLVTVDRVDLPPLGRPAAADAVPLVTPSPLPPGPGHVSSASASSSGTVLYSPPPITPKPFGTSDSSEEEPAKQPSKVSKS